MAEEHPELRADPAFKLITNRLAEEVGLKLINAEFPQSLVADLVLEIPAGIEENLNNSIFSFLKGYQYAIVDFKGENDQLTLHKFINNLARTALFCLKREEVPVAKVLNLYVTSARPTAILNAANRRTAIALLANSPEQPWLWRSKDLFFQEIAIVVCRDLPVEPRYYDWLVFAPAGSEKWREFVETVARQKRYDLLVVIKRLTPKEYRAMELNVREILAQLDPQQREKIDEDYAEILEQELPELAVENPRIFAKILGSLAEKLPPDRLAEIAAFLAEQARKKAEKNGHPSNGSQKE